VLALAVRLVGIAGRLVPIALRGDWEREWRAELWHLYRSLQAQGRLSGRERAAFVLRSVGSVADALQLRLGDAETWSESFSAVETHWRRHTPSVTIALLFLSLGMAADALLLAFGRLMLGVPRSEWSTLSGETRLLILGIAITCGVSLIVASAAAATRLLGSVDASPRVHRSVWVMETVLVAGVTTWVGGWFAAFGMRAIPSPSPAWLSAVDLGPAVTNAWLVSWICGLTVLTVLRVPRRGGTSRLVR
jgi:hypothetical protein